MSAIRQRVLPRAWAAGVLLGACGGGSDVTAPVTGTLEIDIATTGVERDPDGYALRLDGGPGEPVEIVGVFYRDVTPGIHTVELTEVSDHCVVAEENPQTVSVAAGDTTRVGFTVACGPTIRVGGAIDLGGPPPGLPRRLEGAERAEKAAQF